LIRRQKIGLLGRESLTSGKERQVSQEFKIDSLAISKSSKGTLETKKLDAGFLGGSWLPQNSIYLQLIIFLKLKSKIIRFACQHNTGEPAYN
jgi:hypothetical protein